MRKALAFALAACVSAGCLAPPRLAVTERPAPLVVSVGQWDSYHRGEIARAVDTLNEAGLSVRLAPRGAWRFEHAEAPGRCAWAGLTDPAHRAMYVDPVCTPGAPAFRATVAHELLHAFRAAHVCRYRGELPDATHPGETCSSVGYGRAVLNPSIAYPVQCDPYNEPCGSTDVTEIPTALDLAEVRRAQDPRTQEPRAQGAR